MFTYMYMIVGECGRELKWRLYDQAKAKRIN